MGKNPGQMMYRGYWINYNPPPIPIRTHDYHYWHDDYEGPGDHRHGTAESIDACKKQIDEIYIDDELIESLNDELGEA